MKPDWKDAPEWAQYVAMDSNRVWYWFEKEPAMKRFFWELNDGDWQAIPEAHWQDSLEKRPEKQEVEE
jgi:hypothetical protein